MPYKHFGARSARLDRFDSCTLHHLLEGTATLRCCALANCSRNPALALAHPFIRGHSNPAQRDCWVLATVRARQRSLFAHPVLGRGIGRCGYALAF